MYIEVLDIKLLVLLKVYGQFNCANIIYENKMEKAKENSINEMILIRLCSSKFNEHKRIKIFSSQT
jgi:hypothetical protein